ncbi:MAG: methyltransferase domain-containing protein [Deltaproteobacteria bacterium]|nr:methyltransferase domain-containing protein [Deltaproteobacteria bacterium]
MFDVIAPSLEEKLLGYVKRTYLPERYRRGSTANAFTHKDVDFFAPAVEELSSGFTAEREELPKNYLNKKEFRSAYLLYFFLPTYTKVRHCLLQLELQKRLPRGGIVDVLDLGSGPGAAGIACAHHFSAHSRTVRLNVHAVDQNEPGLRDATELFRSLAYERHRLATEVSTLTPSSLQRALKGRRYDLIIAANLLNECGSVEDQERFCHMLIEHHLTDNGLLLVIDPALQKTTRDLMAVRDHLLEKGLASVVAPCLHQKFCPMRAANRRDWCHFYIEWRCPKIIRQLDHLIGNNHDHLKMAYFVFAPLSQPSPSRGEGKGEGATNRWRVVSSPMPSTGKTEMLLCGETGELQRISQLDRDMMDKQKSLWRIKRGDVVEWPREKQRLARDEQIPVVSEWNGLTRPAADRPTRPSRPEEKS